MARAARERSEQERETQRPTARRSPPIRARSKCTDPVALNLWHPVGAVVELAPGTVNETQLLEEAVSYGVGTGGDICAWRSIPELPAGSRRGLIRAGRAQARARRGEHHPLAAAAGSTSRRGFDPTANRPAGARESR